MGLGLKLERAGAGKYWVELVLGRVIIGVGVWFEIRVVSVRVGIRVL